jgi:hypothetical protein
LGVGGCGIRRYLANVDRTEALKGLDLLVVMSEQGQTEVESVGPERMWPVGEGDFTEGCRGSRGYMVGNDPWGMGKKKNLGWKGAREGKV